MPEEMRPTWDRWFLDLAIFVALRSRDPSTKTGCVIVDQQKRVVGLGFNGFPRGVADHEDRYNDREMKYKLVVHSEANAILNAIGPVSHCVLYSTKFPCSECAKLIIQAGIKTVVVRKPDLRDPSVQRWREDAAISRDMMLEAGLVIKEIP